MGQVIAVANQKGGVGKTTTAVNTASYLAAKGHRVLLVDLDPQGNATSGLGVDKNDLEHSLYDGISGHVTFDSVVVPVGIENLWLAPSNRQLVGAEVELVDATRREYRLREALEPVSHEYDFVFIDCPPSLSLLTVNGLTAASGVLITLQCEYYALEGLSELLQTIKLVRDNLNQRLRLKGVLLTMHTRTRLAAQVEADVREHLGSQVYETIIPRNVTLGEAPSFGQPVLLYDPSCAGAQAYAALAEEILKRG